MQLIKTLMNAMIEAGLTKPETATGFEYLTSIYDDLDNATFNVTYRSPRKIFFTHVPSQLVYFFEKTVFENGTEILSLYLKDEKKDVLITNSYRLDDMSKNKNLIAGYNRIVGMVRSYDELVRRCEAGQQEFYMLVGGCMRSSKNIVMTGKDEFSILNEIDGEYQDVTKETLETETNIMTAINEERFFAYDGQDIDPTIISQA